MKKISSDVKLGKNVVLNDFINLYGCTIGDETKIGPFVEIQKNAVIGKRCKISSHTFICEGVNIEDGVFVGHGVVFINDKYPGATNDSGKLQTEEDWQVIPTVVKQGASIGSNATLLCGITVGSGSIIGAGSVVIDDVPDNVIVAGNPAKIIRKIKNPSD
ncbi:MAG: N-acetyltransferase [Deltaproteobacteria bacterium]|nr:N-acetyltransferase [Deltaproteobacteria bacterium]